MKDFIKTMWSKIRVDGLLHIETSFVLFFFFAKLSSLIIPSWDKVAMGVILSLLVGVGKEIYDRRTGKGTAEKHDLICDIFGVFIAVLLV